MPKRERSELAAGLFVVLSLAAVLGVLFWLGSAKFLAKPKAKAYFFFPQYLGSVNLAQGAEVRLGGNFIGQISTIQYRPGLARPATEPATHPATAPEADKLAGTLYIVELDWPDLKLYSNGTAETPFSLVGQGMLVVTDPGKPAPGAYITSEQQPLRISPGMLESVALTMKKIDGVIEDIGSQLSPAVPDSLMSRVRGLTDGFKETTTKASSVMGRLDRELDAAQADSVIAKMHASVKDINAITGNLARESDPNNKDGAVAHISEAAKELARVLEKGGPEAEQALKNINAITGKIQVYVDGDLGEIVANIKKGSVQVNAILGDLSTASGTLKDVVVLNRHQLDEVIGNLGSMAANLAAAAKEVRRNPWRLLQTPDAKEIRSQNTYDAVRSFSEGARQLDDALARLKALRELSPDGVKGADPELAKIRESLKASFEQFKKVEEALFKQVAP